MGSGLMLSGCPHRKTGFYLTYFKKNGTHRRDKMRNIFCNVFRYSTKKKTRHMDGCWISHCISLGLSYTSFPRNGFTAKNSELVKFHECFCTIFPLFYVM
jgi:hypothetical protein